MVGRKVVGKGVREKYIYPEYWYEYFYDYMGDEFREVIYADTDEEADKEFDRIIGFQFFATKLKVVKHRKDDYQYGERLIWSL